MTTHIRRDEKLHDVKESKDTTQPGNAYLSFITFTELIII
jgi:hypothetical protein